MKKKQHCELVQSRTCAVGKKWMIGVSLISSCGEGPHRSGSPPSSRAGYPTKSSTITLIRWPEPHSSAGDHQFAIAVRQPEGGRKVAFSLDRLQSIQPISPLGPTCGGGDAWLQSVQTTYKNAATITDEAEGQVNRMFELHRSGQSQYRKATDACVQGVSFGGIVLGAGAFFRGHFHDRPHQSEPLPIPEAIH
jgi:hypothetical protein